MNEVASESKEVPVRPPLWDRVKYPFERLFSRTVVASQCGHKTRSIGKIKVHGGYTIMAVKLKKGATVPYCLACVEKACIRCAWCGKYITPGNAITLCRPAEGATMPDYAVKYEQEGKPTYYVGCLRWGCADTGLDRAGFWDVPGCIRHDSMLQKVMGDLQQNKVVFIQNVDSPDATITTYAMPKPDAASEEANTGAE